MGYRPTLARIRVETMRYRCRCRCLPLLCRRAQNTIVESDTRVAFDSSPCGRLVALVLLLLCARMRYSTCRGRAARAVMGMEPSHPGICPRREFVFFFSCLAVHTDQGEEKAVRPFIVSTMTYSDFHVWPFQSHRSHFKPQNRQQQR